ncbi:hypothetical protein PSHT_04594 [Puccinia striiformis]|uniref:Ig-like domain-containing protein n=1 Tax=Puccinia striiformis TaxID=27350 RepID=A0A2S4WCJ3_9BASI|nr:hypothetical protein PSHT_11964 [Puccinia striiformis]POW19469.1 hypothetical protein PSHT_04594 [Puccinia striiformis]
MFKNSLSSSMMVGIRLLISLSSTVSSATVEASASAKHQVECHRRWSTEDPYKDEDSVTCEGDKVNVCNARTCHMGGPTGTADTHPETGPPLNLTPITDPNLYLTCLGCFPVGKDLFFDKCAKIDNQGKELTDAIYQIFPRTYKFSNRSNIIIARGFAPSEATYQPATFKCTFDRATNFNTRTVWCDAPVAK